MPAGNPRVNVVVDKPLYDKDVGTGGQLRCVPERDLVREAIELREEAAPAGFKPVGDGRISRCRVLLIRVGVNTLADNLNRGRAFSAEGEILYTIFCRNNNLIDPFLHHGKNAAIHIHFENRLLHADPVIFQNVCNQGDPLRGNEKVPAYL